MARQPIDIAAGGVGFGADRWPGPAPHVVFLHAGVADRRCWYAVAGLLDGELDMLAVDRRGYGDTPAGTGSFRHVDDLLAAMDVLGGEPAVLVGNSLGAGIALDAALTAPSRVAAMVLIAPAVSGLSDPDSVDAGTLVLGQRLQQAYADGDNDQIARLHAWLWLDGPSRPEGRVGGLPRALARDMSLRMLGHGDTDERGDAEADAWSRLERIRVPVTVACGEYDVPFLRDRSRTLAARLPAGRFVDLAGTAHLPSLDQPELVASLVRDVAADLRRSGPAG